MFHNQLKITIVVDYLMPTYLNTTLLHHFVIILRYELVYALEGVAIDQLWKVCN